MSKGVFIYSIVISVVYVLISIGNLIIKAKRNKQFDNKFKDKEEN